MNGTDFLQLADRIIRRTTSEWPQVAVGARPVVQPDPEGVVDPLVSLMEEICFSNYMIIRNNLYGFRSNGMAAEVLASENGKLPGTAELDVLLADREIIPTGVAPEANSIGTVFSEMSACYFMLNHLIKNWEPHSSVSVLNDLLSRFFGLQLRARLMVEEVNRRAGAACAAKPAQAREPDGMDACTPPRGMVDLGATFPSEPEWLF
jgi:hypothetical protein